MICGLTAEFNPFHNGHDYLIKQLRSSGVDTVIAAMSGNYVQRGEPAVCDKLTRAAAAVACGVDLVIELPTAYAVAGAQRFARGGVRLLAAAGCDSLGFGCECGDTRALEQLCDYTQTPEFKENLAEELRLGRNYPSAMCKAAKHYAHLLEGANNTLALEYIRAAKELMPDCRFIGIKRVGPEHDAPNAENGFAGASALRTMLAENRDIAGFIPQKAAEILASAIYEGKAPADYKRLETAALLRLRTMSDAEIAALPDVSEGLEHRIRDAALHSSSLEQLYGNVKSKRFTHARIRRIVLYALLGFDKALFELPIPYIRPLAFNENGQAILKNLHSSLPVYSKSAAIAKDANCRGFFEAERRATAVYALTVPQSSAVVDEIKLTPLKIS